MRAANAPFTPSIEISFVEMPEILLADLPSICKIFALASSKVGCLRTSSADKWLKGFTPSFFCSLRTFCICESGRGFPAGIIAKEEAAEPRRRLVATARLIERRFDNIIKIMELSILSSVKKQRAHVYSCKTVKSLFADNNALQCFLEQVNLQRRVSEQL